MKKIFFNFLFILLVNYSFGQQCFSPVNLHAAGGHTTSVTRGDFNNDGKMDLAAALFNNVRVAVLIGNGFGGFAAPTNFTTGDRPFSITNADFNGDGNLDLATGNYDLHTVSILLGDGLGGFSPAVDYGIGGFGYSILSSDFNNDGNIDLATANEGNTISVLLGDGTGSFSAAINLWIGQYTYSIVSADFNEDGNMDLASANNSGFASVLLGDGLGGFSAPTNFAIGTNSKSITCNDFNGDGNLDLVTANANSNNISILLGNGSGSFSSPVNFAVGTAPLSITSGDLNGDGNMDVAVVITSVTSNVIILLGDGSGSFSSPNNISTGTGIANPNFITNGDLNDDGKTDIIACSSSDLAVYLNRGFTINFAITNSTCISDIPVLFGNGGIAATVTGGIGFASYLWNTTYQQTATEINGLLPGQYSLTVTDNYTCSATATATVGGSMIPFTNSTTQSNVSCFGGNNGSATVTVSGGLAPYSFSWNTSPIQTTETINNLAAGNYSVEITDAIGCQTFSYLTITEPDNLGLYFETTGSFTNSKCGGTCDGVQNVSVFGGTGPYTFQWDSLANYQTTQVATNLCHGTYFLTATDAFGCTVTDNISVGFNGIMNPEIYLTNLAALDQVSISPAFASYYAYNLPSTITPNPSNPRNFVDPGRKARFKVECTNTKINGQSIVSGICKVRSNNPYITVTDSVSALNNIGWNGDAWSADEFEIDIDPNTPAGTNAYIDFIVQENGFEYSTTCISIPITPLVYSQTTLFTIDDDNNPDSHGNDNEICEPGEIIEFYPWLDNISTLNAEYVRGKFENLDNLNYINIWDNVPGVGTTVYDETWWNFAFAQPQVINSSAFGTTPEYDFVFNYDNTGVVNNFDLHMVMAGGFKLFSGSALSILQWTLPFTFNNFGNTIYVDNIQTICEGTSYTINGNSYNLTGTYQDVFQSINGFDSIVNTILTVNPVYAVNNPQVICQGSSYSIGGNTYSSTGTYIDNLQSSTGCDSIVTTILTVNSSYAINNPQTICQGDSYLVGGSTYTSTGTYQNLFQSIAGCDSLITTILTVNPSYNVNNPQTICSGGAYVINGQTYISPGTYVDVFQTQNGCDSIVNTQLNVVSSFNITNPQAICPGDSYSIGGNTYTSSGTYVNTLQSIGGCDSIVTTVLTVNPTYSVNNPQTICFGDSYSIGGSTYTSSGTYVNNFQSISGCDSTVTTSLTVRANILVNNPQTICQGDSYTIGINTYTIAGTYQNVLTTINGCDSTVTTILTVNNPTLNTNVSISPDELTLSSLETNATYQWVNCANNFVFIGEATNQDFTPVSNGNYAVILTSLTCNVADTSNCFTISNVGFENLSAQTGISIFPNPTNSNFEINGNSNIIERIQIFNADGKLIFEQKPTQNTLEIDAQKWSDGVYWIEMGTKRGIIHEKLIKE